MGGWVISVGEIKHFRDQVERLGQVFSVPGVPDLRLKSTSFSDHCNVIHWGWSRSEGSDVSVAEAADGQALLILDGYITGIGEFCSESGNGVWNASSLLDLWREHGLDLLPELNGSFSCTFINLSTKEAVISTDRIASRSVWFSREDTIFYAGNYPAAIAALQRNSPHLDPAGLWSLFLSSRHVGRRGLYHGMVNLQAGQYAVLGDRKIESDKVGRWYKQRYRPEIEYSSREWGAQVAEELRNAAKRLKNVTPALYLFLSGGLDSRVAVGALEKPATTITLTSSPNNRNVRISERVAAQVGTAHQTMLRAPYWYLNTFEAAALAAGGNYNLLHAHFAVPIQNVKENVSDAAFMLGDLLENFKKHYFKQTRAVPAFIPEKIPDLFTQIYSYSHPDPVQLKRLFQPELIEVMTESWRQELTDLCRPIREVSEDDRDCFDTLFRWNNCSLCPTYLMVESIRPMAGERNLMFDNGVLDLYYNIPAGIRGRGTLHPWILWHLDKSLVLISDSNYWLPPIAPKMLKQWARKLRPVIGKVRRKTIRYYQNSGPVIKTEGSWHMMHEWYRKDEKHRRFIEACLFDEACFPPDIFNLKEIEACWQNFLSGEGANQYGFEVDMLLSFGLLHRRIPSAGVKLS